ncbi:tRNA (guanine-N(7)-)-methyltransferase (TRMB) [Vairimorpha necatrix]|uniref:tRNA (guanine-N(7)-)-methyltransferase n=1 Tax=Vairimorpha necatrix TaxID=6039 RepID=A0AAX4J887_9MICR
MEGNISKRDYRQRAHSNPFKDSEITIPSSPASVDWSHRFQNGLPPSFLDIGCGYGKFLMKEGTHNILGLEIRDKVFEYVKAKISELNLTTCSVMKTNALLFLPNIFHKYSLDKIFILFPDPHFKRRKQKGRVVCRQMIHIYEYLLSSKGRLYISTDVVSLFEDMKETILGSNLFIQIFDEVDPYYEKTFKDTDEALRAGVKTGATYAGIFIKK